MALSKPESACVYASLILADDDINVTAEKIQTILKAADIDVEPYWPGLFAKALESAGSIKDLITNVGSAVGAAPAGGAAPAAAAAAPEAKQDKKEEKKKEESEDEEDDDMGFGLFE
ncbi:60S acidic ribosomal protein P1 [Daktulosphaira vitifoliae]|uniref:60S acidic ribosomal protein P1 n=1 Tax=Daktulosphaira vitifoliae TaxID=58002 RepID=UPI0021AA9BA2|nr:60S acidic ribosomal protein P1 [Daktulosphaira vitifoliae]